MIRRFFLAVEEWTDDQSDILALLKMGLVITVGIAILASPVVYWALKTEESAQSQCMASGGGWAVVGHHRQTTFILVGKVMVPSTTTVTDYGCVSVSR